MQGAPFTLTLFTNDPVLARAADEARVDRIGPDLESLGKRERQEHLDTRMSDHSLEDVAAVRAVLRNAKAFVRVNPLNPGSRMEVESLLEAGVQVLMLPMLRSAPEVATFVDMVGGRARVVLLLETAAAGLRLRDIVRVPGVDEIHFGLNDLRLSLGVASHFEVLASDWMELLCRTVGEAGIPYGIAAVAQSGDAHLPVPSDLAYAQYARLGSQGALLARCFFKEGMDLQEEVRRIRERMDHFRELESPALAGWREALIEHLRDHSPVS